MRGSRNNKLQAKEDQCTCLKRIEKTTVRSKEVKNEREENDEYSSVSNRRARRLLISGEFSFPPLLINSLCYYILRIDHDQNMQKIKLPFNKTVYPYESLSLSTPFCITKLPRCIPPSISTLFLLKTSRHGHPFLLPPSFYYRH